MSSALLVKLRDKEFRQTNSDMLIANFLERYLAD